MIEHKIELKIKFGLNGMLDMVVSSHRRDDKRRMECNVVEVTIHTYK